MAFKLLKDGKMVQLHQEPFDHHGTTVYLTRSEVGRAGDVHEHLGSVLEQEVLDGEHEGVWEVVSDDQEPEAALEQEESPSDDAHLHGEDVHEHRVDYEAMRPDDLAALAREHEVGVEGTGAGGNVLKADLVKALVEHHEALEGDDQGSGR